MIEAIHLEGSHLKVKKKTFVLASAWEPNPFKQFYERLQGDPVWITGTIESGHDAMLDKPEELASLLREAASDYRQVGVTGNMSISHRAEFMAHPLGIYFDYLTPDDSGHQVNVVMVHGGSHTGGCYLMTAEGKPGWANRFAERGYRVGVPDWPGHGRSGAHNLRALTGEQVCQSLAALISGLNGPVVLLTHSMGSALGWRVAELCGDKIIAIVGIAPAPSGNIQPGPEILSDSEEGLGLQTPFRTLTLRHKGAVLVTPEFVVDKLADNRMQ
jgi:pimeloyl-ACP methyl ester carboxylesterase